MSDIIFALDIGTRKVMGIVAKKEKKGLRIIDCETREHEARPMLDGQIHNVEEVAEVVQSIKETLEKRTKEKLERVAVAVAGRALKTLRGKANRDISLAEEITAEEVHNLELVAVDRVLSKLSKREEEIPAHFYCIDYSVVSFELDGSRIDNLIGHRGTNIGVEVLATFLPRVVVNSMLTVLKRAKLKPVSLTLEPIAAINVIIPTEMRRMNLLLADIGAGTSDMALTREGSVMAYGMVPLAGDEITEKICDEYLVDFSTAERMKRSLEREALIEYEDLVGKKHLLESKEILKRLSPVIEKIAQELSRQILELNNGQPPQGVINIGGSSQMPLLKEMVARELGINIQRVGIRTPRMIRRVKDDTGKLTGPEAVTPIGIAVTAAQSKGLQIAEVSINGKGMQLINISNGLNVLKALVAAGIDTKKIHGRHGTNLTYYLNGEKKIIEGEMGRPAIIKVNGHKASLETKIKDKDSIEAREAQEGKDAEGRIRDVVGARGRKRVRVNGIPTQIPPLILMNGHRSGYDTKVTHGAKIEVKEECDLRRALTESGFDVSEARERKIHITLNGKPKTLIQRNYQVTVNGKQEPLKTLIKEGDEIRYEPREAFQHRIKEVVPLPPNGKDIRVVVNGKPLVIDGEPGRIYMNEQEVSPADFIINGAKITTKDGRRARINLAHIFKYIPRSAISTKGKILRILVDNQKAGFTTPLTDGCEVKIYFE